jgi:AcrR family transcriptional regulator
MLLNIGYPTFKGKGDTEAMPAVGVAVAAIDRKDLIGERRSDSTMPTPSRMLKPKQARSHATRRRLLDAAVEVLVEEGYSEVSAASVARRAGVSRGAHQHHFANRQALVIESIRYMSARQLEYLQEEIGALLHGRSRVSGALELIFEMYSGSFLTAMLELSLAARNDRELKAAIAEEEKAMSLTIHQLGVEVLGTEAFASSELSHRWTAAMATIRGIAILGVLRHSKATIDRQWRFAHGEMLASLLPGEAAGGG